ncbi:MAG: exosortase, partial [Pseudomonadota bacterium]
MTPATLVSLARHPMMILILSIVLVSLLYIPNLIQLVETWLTSDEYGHGILLPFVAAYFVWQRKQELLATPARPTWSSVAIILISLVSTLIAIKTASVTLMSYSYLLVIVGAMLACYGYRFVWLNAFPLLLLVLAVPLPGSTIISLTSQLQLMSSDLGVWMIRLFNIPVFLEGNVIDLGEYQLFVAEACSGLRYLFSLVTLGAVIAYMIRCPL